MRTYRRRAGLTQDELAFLLGCRSGAKVSRYERMTRRPNLQAAFGCHVIFGVPAHELLPGILAEVERGIIKRAHLLSQELSLQRSNPRLRRKLALLKAIAVRRSGAP